MWASTSKALTGSRLFSKLTRAMIGLRLLPLSAAETLAGVTPTDYAYKVGNVLRYGADPSGTADSRSAIQAALDVANQGACEVYVPAGSYKVTGNLNLYKNTKLYGDGWGASRLIFNHAGDGINSTWPINSSTGVFSEVRDISIENTNAANTGGGFVDVGGTFLNLTRCRFYGWKIQCILDQSELVDVHHCVFDGPLNGGACIWLVNGDEHTIGANGLFTNRITVKYCQISGLAGRIGIIDDGGAAHCFEDNNYNGLDTHIRAAGAAALCIKGGEFETAAVASIVFHYQRYFSGVGTGGCENVYLGAGAMLIPVNGTPCISITALSSIVIDGAYLGNTSVAKIAGMFNAGYVALYGVPQIGTSPMLDNNSTVLIVDGLHVTHNVQSANYTFATLDAGRTVKNFSNTAYTYTIPPNSTVPILVGSRIRVVTLGGQVTFARGAGVSLYKAGTGVNANVVLSTGGTLLGVAELEKLDTDTWVVSGTALA
jgi:hypothetical protein